MATDGRPRVLSTKEEVAIARAYAEGVATRVLATQYNVSTPTILTAVKRQGVPTRGRGQRHGTPPLSPAVAPAPAPTKRAERKIWKAFARGDRDWEVAKESGLAEAEIRRLRREWNYPASRDVRIALSGDASEEF